MIPLSLLLMFIALIRGISLLLLLLTTLILICILLLHYYHIVHIVLLLLVRGLCSYIAVVFLSSSCRTKIVVIDK